MKNNLYGGEKMVRIFNAITLISAIWIYGIAGGLDADTMDIWQAVPQFLTAILLILTAQKLSRLWRKHRRQKREYYKTYYITRITKNQ